MGYRLNLNNPQTFSEKLQWLKLYDRRPEYTTMVDKYAVKKYVSEQIGDQYVIPTLGVWERVEDIDWDSLPQQFVLKTTHTGGSNGVVLCRDKNTFNDIIYSTLNSHHKNNIIIQSSDYNALIEMKNKYPDLEYHLVTNENNYDKINNQDLDGYVIRKNLINYDDIKKLIDDNKKVSVWTINNYQEYQNTRSILKELNEQGIKIARRTVAKYRAQLGIENSYNRQ